MSELEKKEFEQLKKYKVVVHSKNKCVQCKMSMKWLKEHNVDFLEVNMSDNPEDLKYVKSLGVRRTPYVETMEHGSWSGFQPNKLGGLING